MACAGAHTTGLADRLDPKEITGTKNNTNPYMHTEKLKLSLQTRKLEKRPKGNPSEYLVVFASVLKLDTCLSKLAEHFWDNDAPYTQAA